MPQTKIVYGKNVSDLISEDTYIDDKGFVIGTLKQVDNYTDFSSILNQQSGYFMPVQLDSSITGTKMDLMKNGNPSKVDLNFDPELVLRTNAATKWAVKVDGTEVLSLDFSKTKFE